VQPEESRRPVVLAQQPLKLGATLACVAAGDIPVPGTLPTLIGVRGARHNNLRDVDVDVPLWRTVAVVDVSGSGKTSLAIGTLYAEGMQRFLLGCRRHRGDARRQRAADQQPRAPACGPALTLRCGSGTVAVSLVAGLGHCKCRSACLPRSAGTTW